MASFGGFGKNSGPTAPPRAQTPFGHFPRPNTTPFSDSSSPPSSAPHRFPSPRSFGTYERAPAPSLSPSTSALDNSRQATTPPQPFVAPSRSASMRWGDRQSPPTRDFGGPNQKRSPPSGSPDIGMTSSKISRYQDSGRSRSPVQYTDDFLAGPAGDGMKGPASMRWGDRQNPRTGDFGGPNQKRSPPSGSPDIGTTTSKDSQLQDMERIRSPVQYTDDFLAEPVSEGMEGNADTAFSLHGSSNVNPPSVCSKTQSPTIIPHQFGGPSRPGRHNPSFLNERSISPTKTADTQQSKELSSKDAVQKNLHAFQDASRRSSLSPPMSRSGTGALAKPEFQYNYKSSPTSDGMKGDTFVKKHASHSVPKRNRSPPPAAGGRIAVTSSFSTEDDTERELQAKAKRLARFKTELDEVGPNDPMQYGLNVNKKKLSSIRTDQSLLEKQKFSGDYLSGSVDDMSQDFDNEDLQPCSVIVGLCADMCPEAERAERERKGDLDQYERLDGDRNQTNKTLAVKKYNRTAEREAELIRPMPILQKTMDYLLGLLDQPYDDRFLGLYNFLWDRMRAIRMDLRMQHIFNLGAISMLEQMIRLHIIAMHELCEFSKGEGFSEGFDAHLNIEQMNKTSVELFQLYDDHRKRGIFVPTEKEFRGYYALLKLDKHPGYKVEPAELSLDLAKMTAEMRQTHEVLFARDVARSCRTCNFIAFFRHARQASYLQACLMHAHFSKLRTQALASLYSGLQYNQGLPVAHLAKWLGMQGENIESLLAYHGFVLKEFEEPYMVKEGPFLNADKDYPTRRSKLVHRKKSNTIMEDILSSYQAVLLPSESKREFQSEKNNKNKHAAVQHIETKSSLNVFDGVMDIDATVSSPRDSMQVQPVETSRLGPYKDTDRMASVNSPRRNIEKPKAFTNFQTHHTQEQPSPVTSKESSPMVDDGKSSREISSPVLFSTPQFVPHTQPMYFEWAREASYGGLGRSSPANASQMVVQSEPKEREPSIISANVGKWTATASGVDSSIAVDDYFMEEGTRKEITDVQHEVENDDVASYHDKEVTKAKLKLLLRLWKRRSARKRELREQNRLAANVALSSLSLGPPICYNRDKPTPCGNLNLDQVVSERYEKRKQSWARWNVSEIVASKLNEKNENSKCICWKLISFSWLHWGNGGSPARNPVSLSSVDQWLQYKLIPAQKDETVNDLVMSAPGMAVWRKWVCNDSGSMTCCLSVIKDAESGNFGKKLVGASAMLFPVSETVPWELQRVQLHNLVTSLPTGASIPLLILSGSSEDNLAELSLTIVDELGLKDIDKSHVGSFLVHFVTERADTGQFDGYFSDQKLKEGLMWLASETCPQPVLSCVTLREIAFSYLNLCLDSLYLRDSDKLGPNQCISVYNEALEQTTKNIVTAANKNPTGWPCPELFLLDDSTAEFRTVRQFLPSLGWSSAGEVEPLLSALRNFKLPSFSDDISFLSRGCSVGKGIEDHRQRLQDCLIRYLTQSSNVMNWTMALKEVDVMLQKCTRLELHTSEYKVVPNWLLIFRRLFNWQLNSLASTTHKVYVLEQSFPTSSLLVLQKSEYEFPKPHPSLDEMVEVSCSPLVSKRVRTSPKSFQNVSEKINSITNSDVGTSSNYIVDEENHRSFVQVQAVDSNVSPPKPEKEADRLSELLNQCNILQDDIERKLSVYF